MNEIIGIIYKAENKINDNCYIGQTIRGLNIRKSIHKNNAFTRNCNYSFSRALRKYGWNNFRWEILTETDSKSKLNVLEKFYIVAYRKMTKLYNMTDGGEGSIGYIPSEITLKKLSESHIGLPSGNKGNKFSDEICKRLSEKAKQRIGKKNHMYNKKHTEESKRKMSEAKKGKNVGEKNPMYGKSLIPWNKGKSLSQETRKKISKSLKGNIPWNKNLKNCYSKEVIEKMVKNRRKRITQIPDDEGGNNNE